MGTVWMNGLDMESDGTTADCIIMNQRAPLQQDGEPEEQIFNEKVEKKLLNEIYDRLEKSKKLSFDYLHLAISLVFVFVYCLVLFLQADIFWSFQVSSAHNALLPPGSSPGEGAVFSNGVTDIYNWLNASFIETSWADPICGNSICESPAERAQFGRFGCEVDCDTYNYTTAVTLSISNFFRTEAEKVASSWNLCMTSPLGLCWFEFNQGFPSLQRYDYKVPFVLPDGNWYLLLNAPYGGVSGNMYYSNNNSDIQRFGGCKENQTELDSCREDCSRLANCVTTNCVNENSTAFDINHGVVSVFVDCISLCSSDPDNPARKRSCAEAVKSTINLVSLNLSCSDVASKALTLSPPPLSPPSSPPPPPRKWSYADFDTSDTWVSLGGNYDEVYNRMYVASRRAYSTYSIDSCLTNSFSQYHNQSMMMSFLAVYLGGPVGDPTYNLNLTQWLSYIYESHKSFFVGQDASDRLIDILVSAIGSVVGFSTTLKEDLYTHLHKLNSPGVLNAKPQYRTCKTAASILPWATGTQLSTNVTVGDVVTWVWTDDNPHSLSARAGSSSNPKFGNTLSYWYESTGGERLVLSRTTTCTPENLMVPVCALEYPSSPAGTFSFSFWFSKGYITQLLNTSNITEKTFEYTSLGSGDTNKGYINFTEETLPDEVFLDHTCSYNCILGKLSDGRCDKECNNFNCNYDGGDCGCPFDDSGISSCPCPANQTHGDDGACCLGGAIGADLQFPFDLQKYDISEYPDANLALSRNSTLTRRVGFQSRVLIGLMVTQSRATNRDFCKGGRFQNFSVDTCPEHPSLNSTAPWGFAPPFLRKSVLYNSTYAEEQTKIWEDADEQKKIWEFKNNAANLTYPEEQKAIWKDANAYNFSHILDSFNEEGVPYGFKPVQINGTNVYKYIVDINLDHDAAANLLQYMADGVFFDSLTRHTNFDLLTYTTYKQTFTLTKVQLTFQNGGKIAITSKIHPLRLQMYARTNDFIRLVLEITIVFFVAIAIILEIKQSIEYCSKGNFWRYFVDGWNYLDIFSLALMVYGIIAWIRIFVDSVNFSPSVRYTIYNLSPGKFFDLLPEDETQISEAVNMFSHIDKLIHARKTYFAIQATNILCMVFRALKMMHFQSRMGIITRTIAEAASDLVHFFILFFIIFLCYSLYGHILLGQTLSEFRSLPMSMNAMLNLLIGDNSFNSYLMQLNTWEIVAATLFYWSFIFLVYLLAFNLLIAIVVDAYTNVKDGFDDSRKTSKEIGNMLQNSYRVIRGTTKSQKALMADLKSLDPSLGSEPERSATPELGRNNSRQSFWMIRKLSAKLYSNVSVWDHHQIMDESTENERWEQMKEWSFTKEEILELVKRAIVRQEGNAPAINPDEFADNVFKHIGSPKKASSKKEKIAHKDVEQLSRVRMMIEQGSAKQQAFIQEENRKLLESFHIALRNLVH